MYPDGETPEGLIARFLSDSAVRRRPGSRPFPRNGRKHEDRSGERHLLAGGGTHGAPRRTERRRRGAADVHGGGSGGARGIRKIPRLAFRRHGKRQHRGGHGDHVVGGGFPRDPLRVASGRLAGGAGVHDGVSRLHGVRRAQRLRGGPIRPTEGRDFVVVAAGNKVLKALGLPPQVLFGGFVWSAYFSLLTSFAPSYTWFIFLRSMVGCGVAAGSQGYVLKTEFIPSKYRAILLPLASIFWMSGSVLIIALGMLAVPTLGWRWMIRLSALPSVFLLFLFRLVPESARFDVSAGNVGAAADTLRRIARMNDASLPPGRLAESVAKKRGSWKDLLNSTFRRTSLLLWYSWFVASLAYYGSVLSSSELLEKNLLCVTDGHRPRRAARRSDDARCYCVPFAQDDYRTLLVSCLGEVSLIPLNIFLLKVLGRRRSLLLLQLTAAVFFVLPSICASTSGFTLLFFLLRSAVSMNFSAVYIYTAEVYPTVSRSLGMGACTSVSRLGGMIAPFIAQVLMSKSVILALSPFSAACALCAVGSFLLPIETKGRALLQTS
ncbi:putative transporter SVOPL isoform X1 [Corythoichthys intestinalis]|uniref:putative transporter SVOPL isoform X1 n=1 Tax=Corythoichthys intestinalis TaxID=161448 RepID=UPI0025A686B9|nr:putative transporter SVOPL isoform X1 [Corythoichthys intestinalis]